MKRNREGVAPTTGAPTDTPAKPQRRQKALSSKAAQLEQTRRRRGEEKKPTVAVSVAASSPPEAVASVENEGIALWDVGSSVEFGGWWWWGVEEEKLLGWFPFAEEDFLCSQSTGREGLFLEEEDHDIWQLQHIHEIPNTVK